MMKILFLVLLSLAGSLVVRQLLHDEQGDRLAHLPVTLIEKCMEMMPEDSPPKVMMSGLQRIQEQNDELLGLQREQNELLRERLRVQEEISQA